jgi:plastocyanin
MLALTSLGLAQPIVTSLTPAPNASAAGRATPLVITSSQPFTAASAGALKVFSSQRGGLRTRGTTTAVVNGNTVRFAPAAYDFRPGETVYYTLTAAAGSATGQLPQRVGQFTTAAGASGGGLFQAGSNPVTGFAPAGIAMGDVDGDGDLDMVTSNGATASMVMNVRLNNGRGLFLTGTPNAATGLYCMSLALGDLDGDGDLDAVVASAATGSRVFVRFNNGSGTFSGTQTVSVGEGALDVVLADFDADGDLDFATANASGNSLSIRLNNGAGVFSFGQEVSAGTIPSVLAVGDVDGDGDLDLVTNSGGGSTVTLRRNNGAATFVTGNTTSVGNGAAALALADVDSDGDLDLLTANYSSNTASVRFNNGSGVFSGGSEAPVGNGPQDLILGDVDGDGDLDLLTANQAGATVSVRLNNGSGSFNGTQEVLTPCFQLALADVDGDSDLDLLVSTYATGTGTVSVRLNGTTGPLATGPAASIFRSAASKFPNPAALGDAVTIADSFSSSAVVSVEVVDLLGRSVRTIAAAPAPGPRALKFSTTGLTAGLYTVRVGHADGTEYLRLEVK